MNDREFLIWVYSRLLNYEEDNKSLGNLGESVDYLHKFRAVITSIPPNQLTPNDGRGQNSIEELEKVLVDAP